MHLWQKPKAKKKEVQWLYGGRDGQKLRGGNGGEEKRREDALVPAHTGKGVDRLLDTRLRLLTLKESLELFLQKREQESPVRVYIFSFKVEKRMRALL